MSNQQAYPSGIPKYSSGYASNASRPKGSSSTSASVGAPNFSVMSSSSSAKSSTGRSSIQHSGGSSKSHSSSKKDSSARSGGATGLAFNTPHQKHLLTHCDWKDKILWASRLILGGNSINGFLKATATAQRIKKQRARQLALTRKSAAAAAAAAAGTTVPEEPEPEKTKEKKVFDQAEEEKLKKDIMNPRTAKKLKSELEAGLQFCVTLHNLLRGVIFEVDPAQAPYLPAALIHDEFQQPTSSSATSSSAHARQQQNAASRRPSANIPPHTVDSSSGPWTVKSSSAIPHGATVLGNQPIQPARPVMAAPTAMPSLMTQQLHQQQQQYQQQRLQPSSMAVSHTKMPDKSAASPGNPSGSTLRKLRKKKLPPHTGPFVNLPEFDSSGKRVCTKKEYNFRIFEVLRFRPLKRGDFVAARLTSRDLWILAKVLRDYPGANMSPVDFLQLSEARRDSLFKDRVAVRDVEEKNEGVSSPVARSLVLPLPTTYSEAAEWGQRLKKGSRVYAMYPQTTSLYSATVVDCTTYCREDDDIIVVEFDGEEPDMTGQVPKYHIPARFVTLIPREFPASQSTSSGGGSSKSNKRKGGPSISIDPSTTTSGGITSTTTSTGSPKKRQSLSSITSTNSTAVAAAAAAVAAVAAASNTGNNNNNAPTTSSADAGLFLDMDLDGAGFDDLDLDFDRPLEAHEEGNDDFPQF